MEEPATPYSDCEESIFEDDDWMSDDDGESVEIQEYMESRYPDIGSYIDLLGDKKYAFLSSILLTFVG